MPNRALLTAATGMQAQQQNVDNIANNIANSGTTGFKRGRIQFQDLVYQNLRSAGGASNASANLPVGLEIGLGTRSIANSRSFLQGDYKETGQPTNMLIEGSGFFQIRLANGDLAYTRDGSFGLNNQGQLVTSSGYQVEPAIQIPNNATKITVGNDGTVSVGIPGQSNETNVGQIQLAVFANPDGLAAQGGNLFKETGASGTASVGTPDSEGYGKISQGYLEGSNVNVVEELVNMISAQRIYETNSKVITTADRMLGTINQAVS
ncbi:MAG: flagellar basal-body rod protein FlgG [Pyrinomonadaceae bacterium]|nr:flagellar basal-body rod protein FlgG [Pyrinomonadaceae bacterium]